MSKKSFEQLPQESAQAYAAFMLWLNMKPEVRDLTAVSHQAGKRYSQIARWSKMYSWQDRTRDYDGHLYEVMLAQAEEVARIKGIDWARREADLREEEWKSAMKAFKMAQEGIERWTANPLRTGSATEIARLLDTASHLGHRATGAPMERRGAGETEPGLKVEVMVALDRVYGPVKAAIEEKAPLALEDRDRGGPSTPPAE